MKTVSPLMLMLLAGCANDPIVDMRGVDTRQYHKDLAECKEYTRQVSTAEEAAKHGAIGTAVGGAIGAAVGNSRTTQQIAGAGAVSGTTKGAARAERRKQQVLYNCLRGRGYNVLG